MDALQQFLKEDMIVGCTKIPVDTRRVLRVYGQSSIISISHQVRPFSPR